MIRFIFCLLIGLSAAALSAQRPDTLQPNNLMDPIIITGSTQPSKASQSPYNIHVISRDQITKMAAQNVADVLQNQSGILLNQDPQLGTGINMQGLSGQSVKILVNGVPAIGRLNGNIDISQIPVSQIERIEIIEGPMSVIYGSDAMGGVINVITKSGILPKSLAINSYSDAVKNTNMDISANNQIRIKQSTKPTTRASNLIIPISINLGRQFFGGIDYNTTTRSINWKPKTKLYGNFGIQMLGNKAQYTMRYNQFYENLLDRSDAEYNLTTVIGYNKRYFTHRRDLSIQSNFSISNKTKIQWSNAYNFYGRHTEIVRRDLVTGNETPTKIGETDTTVNRLFNSRAIVTHISNSNLEWLYGYDLNIESLKTLRIGGQKSLNDAGIFLQSNIKIGHTINIRPGVRFIYNSIYGSNPFGNAYFGPGFKLAPAIPSLQAKIQKGKFTMRASFAKGYRAPTLKETHFLFVDINHNVRGNTELKAESANNFIVSIERRIGKIAAKNSRFQGKILAKTFFNRVENQIQLSLVDPSNLLYQYINIGKLNSRGFSLDFNAVQSIRNVKIAHENKLTAQFGIDIIQSMGKISDSSHWVGFQTIQGKANLSYSCFKEGLSFQIFGRYSGKTLGFLSSGETYTIKSFALIDASMSKHWEVWHSRIPLDLQWGCKNLLGVTQIMGQPALGGPHTSGGNINIAQGRAIFISLMVGLG